MAKKTTITAPVIGKYEQQQLQAEKRKEQLKAGAERIANRKSKQQARKEAEYGN